MKILRHEIEIPLPRGYIDHPVSIPQTGLHVMDQKNPNTEHSTRDAVSEKRRKLLKTAATTAPVIATLQSGAAFANTSAFQCIDDATRENSVHGWVRNPARDNWVRKEIKRYKYKKTNGRNKGRISAWWYDVDGNHDGNSPEGPYYRVKNDGSLASRSFNLNRWKEHRSETVHVLVYYQPNVDNTAVTEQGVYPKYYVAPPYDANLPINASCLASMA